MPLIERIEEDFKSALKSGDRIKTSVLRLLKSALKNKEIELQRPLTDDDCLSVISSQIKQRKDSIEQYEKAGRADLAANEKAELDILTQYLPDQLSQEGIIQLIKETIKETGAKGPKDMGIVMKALMPKIKGRADGKLVNRIVKEVLEKGQ
jgi:uncharacterized protein YqeY